MQRENKKSPLSAILTMRTTRAITNCTLIGEY